jgi:hypothetical protein
MCIRLCNYIWLGKCLLCSCHCVNFIHFSSKRVGSSCAVIGIRFSEVLFYTLLDFVLQLVLRATYVLYTISRIFFTHCIWRIFRLPNSVDRCTNHTQIVVRLYTLHKSPSLQFYHFSTYLPFVGSFRHRKEYKSNLWTHHPYKSCFEAILAHV